VLFETKMMRRQIEAHIEAGLRDALGFHVATFVRNEGELADVSHHVPFDERAFAEGDTLNVAFLKAPPAPASQEKLMSLAMRSMRSSCTAFTCSGCIAGSAASRASRSTGWSVHWAGRQPSAMSARSESWQQSICD
jgi:hypothetical protein